MALVAIGMSGCATAPVQTAGIYANNTYHAAAYGAHAIYTTGGDVYSGVGTAAKQPFRDLNMMQDPIAPVLLRAEAAPYDTRDLQSCNDILNGVAELDLALGPDLDSPKDQARDRGARVASLASAAALDAAASAAEGFLPMRSVIKRVTGATRYEEHVKRAMLAGTERRAFLKAFGMQHNCSWPAAPLGFQPVVVTIATTPLATPPLPLAPTSGARVLYASAAPATRTPARRAYAGTRVYAVAAPRPAAPAQAARPTVMTASAVSALGPTMIRVSQTTVVASAAVPRSAAYVSTSAAMASSSEAPALSPSAAFAAPWGGAVATSGLGRPQ